MDADQRSYFYSDRPVMVITGPTASGKTETALLLAEALGGEIVSADSMQVYRGLDVGTAKTPPALRCNIPHHMLDICEPCERFSVADYKAQASQAIRGIYDRGNRPIVCGGTGQYISALIEGLVFPDAPADPDLRGELGAFADEHGLESLYDRLGREDPAAAARISPGDRKRIIRALELIMQTGRTQAENHLASHRMGPEFDFKSFCLCFDRPVLYERINRRVLAMFEGGLEDEVRDLLAAPVPSSSTCLQAIGYKEMIPYLAGQMSRDETITLIQQATRRYAKRQLTWFRKMDSLIWLINHNTNENLNIILGISKL